MSEFVQMVLSRTRQWRLLQSPSGTLNTLYRFAYLTHAQYSQPN